MSPVVSVVIVNYNHLEYLRECLASLYVSDLPNFEVLVVDNHTTEGDVQDVVRQFPNARLLRQSSNTGFARGNNIGIRQAQGEFLFLLNNDASIARRGWADISKFFTDQEVAAIQPMILIAGTDRVNNCGLRLQYLGFSWDDQYRHHAADIQAKASLAAFSGAAVLLRRSALNQLGGFDERYFMYHEDVDLSCRLRWAGYEIRLQPGLQVQHHYTYKGDSQRYYWLERNRALTVLKNYPWGMLLICLPPLLLMELGMIFYSLSAHWFLKKLQASGGVLRHLPYALRARRGWVHRVSMRQFFGLVIGPIDFVELRHPLLNRLVNPILDIYWRLIRRLIHVDVNRQQPSSAVPSIL